MFSRKKEKKNNNIVVESGDAGVVITDVIGDADTKPIKKSQNKRFGFFNSSTNPPSKSKSLKEPPNEKPVLSSLSNKEYKSFLCYLFRAFCFHNNFLCVVVARASFITVKLKNRSCLDPTTNIFPS